MTHAISVPTPFMDIAELAESFAARVDEERVMLPNAEPIAEGEWVQFSVTFADGSSALAGSGRCTGSYDNGEALAPEHRFDVVMDSLELDEMGQVYFERILMVRAQLAGGAEPTTGQVEVVSDDASYAPVEVDPVAVEDAGAYAEALPDEQAAAAEHEVGATFEGAAYEAADEVAAPVFEEAPAPAEAVFDAFPVDEPAPTEVWDTATVDEPAAESVEDVSADELVADVASVDDVVSDVDEPAPARSWTRSSAPERLAPPVAAIYALPPPAAPGQLPSPHANGEVLTRRLVEATWTPTPMLRPDPSPSTGHFQYGDAGLPRPEHPPRPAIDPSLRVVRAPRPGDPLAAPLMRSGAAVAAGGAAVAYAEETYAGEAYPADAYAEEVYPAEVHAQDAYAEDVQPAYAEDAYAEDAHYEAQPEGEQAGETRQVDIGALDEAYGEEPMAFDIPAGDDEG